MSLYRAFAVIGLCLVSLVGFAQQAPVDAYDADSHRANALLVKAVAEFKAKGDVALAEFSRQGAYVDGDLYIYVVDTSGVMLASGGPSVSLVGKTGGQRAGRRSQGGIPASHFAAGRRHCT
jgi:cytochrome c